MTILIINISKLVNVREENELLRGIALAALPCIDHAFLLVENETIAAFGHMHDLELRVPHPPKQVLDAQGSYILPCWCDSHTHIVYPASREDEFVHKLQGKTYAEIAAMGGGILNSAARLATSSEDELFNMAMARLKEVALLGTGAIEIKSGYGLSTASEIKILRVIKRMKQHSSLIIKATFLGAHTYPVSYRDNHEEYIRMITEEMLPVIEKEGLADFIDVFCEQGFFSPSETERICIAGKKAGLIPKLHVNQLSSIGGIQTAIKMGALSADHLETMTQEDIEALAASGTIGTMLPTAAFFLRMQYQPAREMISAGCAVALASDYNPGSSPGGNMNFVNALACIQMKMLPEEVINASTINGAFAMGIEREAGSISVGKKANLIFTKSIPSLAYLPYSFSANLIDKVMVNGNFVTN
jgi:imidazolonepropionase